MSHENQNEQYPDYDFDNADLVEDDATPVDRYDFEHGADTRLHPDDLKEGSTYTVRLWNSNADEYDDDNYAFDTSLRLETVSEPGADGHDDGHFVVRMCEPDLTPEQVEESRAYGNDLALSFVVSPDGVVLGKNPDAHQVKGNPDRYQELGYFPQEQWDVALADLVAAQSGK
jgi:hypothetical protein